MQLLFSHDAIGCSEAMQFGVQIDAFSHLASEVRDFTISPDYQHLTVTELVERIEVTANQMVVFGELMLEAAHAGLVEAACDDELDSDASTWHLPSLAEAHI